MRAATFSLLLVVQCGCLTQPRGGGTGDALHFGSSDAESRDLLVKHFSYNNLGTASKSLFDGWGRHDEVYDGWVVYVLRTCHRPELWHADAMLVGAVKNRLSDEPRLIRQVFWHERWEAGLHGKIEEFSTQAPYLVQLCDRLSGSSFTYAEQFFWIVKVSSMLDRPELITGYSADDVPLAFRRVVEILSSDAAYMVWDANRGSYVVNDDAKDNGVAVRSEEQLWDAVPTPLPASQVSGASYRTLHEGA